VTEVPTYLAIDPGEKYNGWATFRDSGDLITMGTIIGVDELTDWLERLDHTSLKRVIVEDYRLGIVKGKNFGAAKQQGSRALTVKTIGRIESWAYRNGKIPVELQPNSIKPTAYMWAGITVPKNKNLSHETDAYVHGVYWLQRNGIRRPQQGRRV
jgi:hypothetical protein